MKIIYEPEQSQSGISSLAEWDNPALHRALEMLFDVKPHEKLVACEVTKQGIKAIFEVLEFRKAITHE